MTQVSTFFREISGYAISSH